jgi:hypothetical protein
MHQLCGKKHTLSDQVILAGGIPRALSQDALPIVSLRGIQESYADIRLSVQEEETGTTGRTWTSATRTTSSTKAT